ncbi:hypothetical protein D3C71_1641860 [compost metagenome]
MGVYTRAYFGKERYDNLYAASGGHSVPIINGEQQAAGEAHRAIVTRYERDHDGVRFDLDLTHAYSPEARIRSFLRSFEWKVCEEEASAEFTLTDHFVFDEVTGDKERSLTEHFISFHKPEINGDEVTWLGEKGKVVLRFDPLQLTAHVETVEIPSRDPQALVVYRLHLLAKQLAPVYTCRLVMLCYLYKPVQ